MIFKSGFSLKNEQTLFDEYINSSDYSVCGFSYGAIKAFKYVKAIPRSNIEPSFLRLAGAREMIIF